MAKARKYVVVKKFDGLPKRSDFKMVEYELPPLQNGEILLKTEWISMDPYLRAYATDQVPYDQFSMHVGVVQESKDPRYPVGTRMVTHKGWCDHVILKVGEPDMNALDFAYKLPDLKGLSPSLGVGAVGMPGATAYLAFPEICKPKAGETVAVTGAAGAVGTLVGQLAKIKGCRVIGFAGSDDKLNRLKQLGYDEVINYKKENVAEALKKAAPNGVDCYFDNVGGEISSIIIQQMNRYGRITGCGSISSYNEKELPKATILQPSMLFKRLTYQGFVIWDHYEGWPDAHKALVELIISGQLKTPEYVTEGFDKAAEAFIDMLRGVNFGKAVVKV